MRVKFYIDADKRYCNEHMEIFIQDFPHRLCVDDLITIDSMRHLFAETELNEGQSEQLASLCYHVDFISWETDSSGIYQMVYLVGE